MKKHIYILLLLAWIIGLPALSHALTTVNGNVSNQTWVNTQTYYVSGSIWVDNGSTLTIQPGTVVKFAPNTNFMVYGTLIADGTSGSNIIFTSRDDNTVGETAPGSDAIPNPGDWYNITVNGSGSYLGDGRFDYCEIRYSGLNYSGELCSLYVYSTEFGYFKNSTVKYSINGGVRLYSVSNYTFSNNTIQNNNGTGVECYYSPVIINACTFSNNGANGIYLYSSNNTVINCTITGNGQNGIYGSSTQTGISSNQISNNGAYAAKMESSTIVQYTGNTGSNNYYNAFLLNGTIDSDLNLSASSFGFPVVLNGSLVINNTRTVTIPAGEVIKMDMANMTVYGALNADGTPQNRVVFTSFKDDTHGGDLNHDGSATSPAKGDWYMISINGNGANWGSGVFDNCLFRYGGRNYSGELCMVYIYATEYSQYTNNTSEYSMNGGVRVYQSNNISFTNNTSRLNDTYGFDFYYTPVTVANCTSSNNSSYGMYLYSCNNLVENCTITNNGSHGIYGSSTSSGISGCTFSNNNGWAARMENSTIQQYTSNTGTNNYFNGFAISGTIDSDLNLSEAAFGFSPVIIGGLTVNNTKTVTIPAGEVIKMDMATLMVYGGITADGTASEPVVFTSFKDDTYGGDMNHDGSATSPAKGDWYMISVNGSGSNWGTGIFDNCLFRYGGRNYSGELCTVYIYGTESSQFTNNTVEYSMNGGVRVYQSVNVPFSNNISRLNDTYGFDIYYSPVTVSNCTATNNNSYGIFIYSSGNLVENCTITNNGSHGIYGSSTNTGITGCIISNNNGWAARMENSTIQQYAANTGTNNFYNGFALSGTIDTDLNLSGSAFGFSPVIIGLLTVNNGKTVTIPAGEVIKMDMAQFQVYGVINAVGTSGNPVVFTSFKDDSYGGDMNHDGSVSVPAKGDWYSFNLNGQGSNVGDGTFTHCLFRYGGRNYSGENSTIYYYSTEMGSITHSTIEHSMNYGLMFYAASNIPCNNVISRYNNSFGIYVHSSTTTLQSCTISNNGSHGVYSSSATPTLTGCQISNNSGWAARLDGVNVRQHSGNTGSGNSYDAFAIYGTIDVNLNMSVADFGFHPVITGLLNVNNGVTLTIPAGEVIKIDMGHMVVYGAVTAIGTQADPVVFTSFKDDTYGGDLNNDGNVTTPAKGDWYAINLYGLGDSWGNGTFDYCLFRYGGRNYSGENSTLYFYATDLGSLTNSTVEYSMNSGLMYYSTSNRPFSNNLSRYNNTYGINLYGSEMTLQSSTFINNGSHGLYAYSSTPYILNNTISNNTGWAAKLDACTIKGYNVNYGSGNGYDAFSIYGTIDSDITLSVNEIGFPIVITGNLGVNTSKTVTIPAGEIIKFDNGVLFVYGRLHADGTYTQPIVFTSFKDDSYGGDLNKDGTLSSPQLGDWYNISLYGQSTYDGEGFFDHCIFRYGGNNYYGENAILYFYDNTNGYVKNSVIELSKNSGINATYSPVQLRSNTFRDNTNYGLVVNYSPYPDMGSDVFENSGFNIFRNNNLNNSGQYQMYYYGSLDMPAYNNDWGYYTEAFIDQHIFDDNETGTSGEVIFNPWFDPGDENWSLYVDFTVDYTMIHTGGTLNFSDLSFGNPDPMTYQWDFESDGIIDSEVKNPAHTYGDPGIYTVTLIVSNGAFERVLTKEAYINVGNFGAPVITSVVDVPGDQGGWVYVNFDKSVFDTDTPVFKSTEYYAVQINDGNGWFSAGYSSAYGEDSYSVICHTNVDSTAYGLGLLEFRVMAGMDEGTYVSNTATGYSVDNIKPAVPTGINLVLGETTIQINWDPCPDADFHYFKIYRSEDSLNFPSEAYDFTILSEYTDNVGANENYYYRISAVDYTGNESDGSSVLTTTRELEISIPQGWSGFSTYYKPVETLTESLLQPIEDKLVIMQNFDGMYFPGQNINTLVNWNILSGYAVKMNQVATLTAVATREQVKTINIPAGWSIIPVLSDNFVNIAELLYSADISVVKDVSGIGLYWPAYGINSIYNLNPGRAYYLKANSPIQITFPTIGGKASAFETTIINHSESPWNDLNYTHRSHVVAFAASSLAMLKPGDVIGAFTTTGQCAGFAVYEGKPFAVTLIGDDLSSSDTEGFSESEGLVFNVLRPETNETFGMDVLYDQSLDYSGKFSDQGMSAVINLKLGAEGIAGSDDFPVRCYPNPTRGMVTVDGLTVATKTEVSNSSGQVVVTGDFSGNGQIDLSHLRKGIYTIKFTNETGIVVRRIVRE